MQKDPGLSHSQNQSASLFEPRDSEARFKKLAESIPQLVWEIGPDNKPKYFNRRWIDYTGIRVSSGTPWEEILHPEDEKKTRSAWENSLANGLPFQVEYRLRQTGTNNYRWFKAAGVPVQEENCEKLSWFGTCTDIHEQKLLELQSLKKCHEAEAQVYDQNFRAELLERLTHQVSSDDVIREATKSLAERLNASRCFLAEIDDEKTLATVYQDYSFQLPSLIGQHDLISFGKKLVESWRNEQVVVVEDVSKDRRTIDASEAHIQLGIRGFMSVRILKNAKYVGVLNITSSEPRKWTKRDQRLLVEVSESVWSAFENARLLSELSKSEARFRLLSDTLPQIVWTADALGAVTYFNKIWFEFTGWTWEQTKGWGWQPLIHAEDQDHSRTTFADAIKHGVAYESEHRFLRSSDKSWRWHLIRSVPLLDKDGKVFMWVGTATDIDEKKRASEEQSLLAKASSLLFSSLDYAETLRGLAKLVVPALADWCVIDLIENGAPGKRIIAHPDPSMLELAEYVEKKYPVNWNSAGGAPNVIRTGKSALFREVSEEQLRASAKDSEHLEILLKIGFRSALIVPIVASGNSLGALSLVSTKVDKIYSQRELEFAEEIGKRAGLAVENARHYREAQQAIRMRDEFLSIASHELRTPVSSLKLQTQILMKKFERWDENPMKPQDLIAATEVSNRQINQLTRLIEDMLDVSRITSGHLSLDLKDCDLAALVKEVLDGYLEQFVNAGVQISVDVEENIQVRCDSLRMEQVVTNLLSNSLKYGEGKPVVIKLTTRENLAVLSVEDNGIGIHKENEARIFDRFERAVSLNNITGLGLGLYISKQIVESHGGRINVESVLGKGSAFTVSLPLKTSS